LLQPSRATARVETANYNPCNLKFTIWIPKTQLGIRLMYRSLLAKARGAPCFPCHKQPTHLVFATFLRSISLKCCHTGMSLDLDLRA
jgi:hypothetical protein